MEWQEVTPTHFEREDGAEVWQIRSDFAASITGSGGLWYGETGEGFQTPHFRTADEAKTAVDAETPCVSSVDCGKNGTHGLIMCTRCLWDHNPTRFGHLPANAVRPRVVHR